MKKQEYSVIWSFISIGLVYVYMVFGNCKNVVVLYYLNKWQITSVPKTLFLGNESAIVVSLYRGTSPVHSLSLNSGELRASIKPQFSAGFSDGITSVLQDELDSCMQLLDLEPDSKCKHCCCLHKETECRPLTSICVLKMVLWIWYTFLWTQMIRHFFFQILLLDNIWVWLFHNCRHCFPEI